MQRDRVTHVWVLLVVATATSWAIGADHGSAASHSAASIMIFVVAFVKVRLVGRHFMELRGAPISLRVAFDAYCVFACACLVGVYAWA